MFFLGHICCVFFFFSPMIILLKEILVVFWSRFPLHFFLAVCSEWNRNEYNGHYMVFPMVSVAETGKATSPLVNGMYWSE
uniref:Uncharacterized protein n=1 Tax=Rhizophora mucronata TaxID=61149 RepID=A0A2P2IRJ1_RHIMU